MITLANGWKLRARQEECHDKLIASYSKGFKEFLIAANCRFGKTVTTLQTLKDLADGDQAIVVISTMSVKNEWKDGAEAVGYDTDLLTTEINDIDFGSLSETGKHVVYCSTQKLGNESDQSLALIDWFNNHSGLKTLVYDECHLGAGTERTVENILNQLAFDNKVYLSGTPYRKHLKKEFGLDVIEGEDKSYLYTIMDERDDYKAGKIADYTPVQLEMHVLDYIDPNIVTEEEIENGAKKAVGQEYGVSSAYFKKIFSDQAYRKNAIEFLNKIIEFASLKGVKNFLFYVPLKKVGNDLVKNFAKAFADKIEFRNLCGEYTEGETESEEEKNAETEAEKLNAFYAESDGKIRIGITCNKCGTGTTLRHLDAVAFLKDTTQAIPFIQKSQRVRTPEEGKSVGYCLCFNQWQGLKAFCDYSRNTSKNEKESEPDAVKHAIENGAVKLVLNLEEVKDYASIIDILNTYRPGQISLFDDFDFSMWPEDTFKFMTTLEAAKNEILGRHPELRNDPDFEKASTADELKKALEGKGLDDESKKLHVPTEEEMRQMLEDAFVLMVRFFFNIGRDVDYVKALDYDETCWHIIEAEFGTEDVWKYIIKTYPRYANMIFNYIANREE